MKIAAFVILSCVALVASKAIELVPAFQNTENVSQNIKCYCPAIEKSKIYFTFCTFA